MSFSSRLMGKIAIICCLLSESPSIPPFGRWSNECQEEMTWQFVMQQRDQRTVYAEPQGIGDYRSCQIIPIGWIISIDFRHKNGRFQNILSEKDISTLFAISKTEMCTQLCPQKSLLIIADYFQWDGIQVVFDLQS